jgi:hypothetical protein|tara:strand:+ start:70 stop:360 length:291 start_codon:yes stop_codon:yes gene_type:complete
MNPKYNKPVNKGQWISACCELDLEMASLKRKFDDNKIELRPYEQKCDQLDEMKEEIVNAWTIQEDELKRYNKIFKKYNKVQPTKSVVEKYKKKVRK